MNDKLKDRVVDMAAEFGSDIVLRCDVANDGDINQLFVDLAQRWDGLDGFVHAIAFARENRWKGIFWIRSRVGLSGGARHQRLQLPAWPAPPADDARPQRPA